MTDRRGSCLARQFCGPQCVGAHTTATHYARASASNRQAEPRPPKAVRAIMDHDPPDGVSPEQAGALRAHVMGMVRVQLPVAHEMVMGDGDWSPAQARLFIEFLDKVLPDLGAAWVAQERRQSGAERPLSREELEEIAVGGDES